jgi:T4 RnlA family RNA ligase
MNKKGLDKLVEEGWLISQVHPSLDLEIYNYSQKTQYEKMWNEETLSSRGLVLNSEGNIVARPFKKFFNLSEVEDKIPDLPFEAFEKMDGSLGIFFWYNEIPIFSSRGSFTSDQAKYGWEILKKMDYESLDKSRTYLFEIIYPENRIVIDYKDDEKIVLLGAIETLSGKEIRYSILEKELEGKGFELVKKWDNKKSLSELKEENDIDREGYVIRFVDGFRIKVKFEEYCRLHRIITNVSNIDIWEKLRDNLPMDEILDKVPDEFYEWVRFTEESLREKFQDVLEECEKIIYSIKNELGDSDRKDYAERIKRERNSGILFNLLDGIDPSKTIWRLVRPSWSKPFKENK